MAETSNDPVQQLSELLDWLPSPVVSGLKILVALGALLGAVSIFLGPAVLLWKNLLVPRLYKPEERKRAVRRAQFANHLKGQIERLNDKEDWKDYRFAELEAEVEAQGRRRVRGLLDRITGSRTRSTLRRERSLSRALQRSSEHRILLSGAPGSGKSVALRRVAYSMSEQAARSRRVDTIIPIYINLKEFRIDGSPVDAEAVRSFVFSTVNRANNRDVAEFLAKEFDAGIAAGTWLFLFDSFDEIPEVLSAIEIDETVKRYADAISEFLYSGFNTSRGVVASRQFRGPDLGWTTFKIVPLTEARMGDLISRANLDAADEGMMKAGLATADPSIKELADNPLFLGLLCDYVQKQDDFPRHPHLVYEEYMRNRFTRDKGLVLDRYGLTVGRVRSIAEEAAYCIAAEPGLGLSPARSHLRSAMRRHRFSDDHDVDVALDALEFIKLARSEEEAGPGRSPGFTFAHRRFQEYFATCVVLREPDRVMPRQLLTDGRWRETAVTICQTQPPDKLLPLLEQADAILTQATAQVGEDLDHVSIGEELHFGAQAVSGSFEWTPGVLHLLSLLDAGFASRDPKLLDSMRTKAGKLLLAACLRGLDHDRMWALEVAGTAPADVLLWMIREAFRSRSTLLREIAYRQVGRLHEIPADIASIIRQALLTASVGGRLRRDHLAVDAQLQRLPHSDTFRRAKDLLLLVPGVDLMLHLGLLVVSFSVMDGEPGRLLEQRTTALLLLLSHLSLYGLRAMPFFTWAPNAFRLTNVIKPSSSVLSWILLTYFFAGTRGGVVLAVVSVADSGSVERLFAWVASLYGVTWSVGALIAVRVGRFVSPRWWWPIIQVVIVERVGAAVGAAAMAVVGLVKRRQFRRLAYWVVLAASLVVYLWLLDFAIKKLDSARFSSFIWVLPALFVLFLLWFGVTMARRGLNDWLWFRRWLRSRQPLLSGDELLTSITCLRTNRGLLRLISTVRTRRLLDGTPSSLAVVDDLSLFILYAGREAESKKRASETRQRRKRTRDSLKAEWRSKLTFASASFPDWLERYLERRGQATLAGLRGDFTDELTKIVDEARGKAAKSASPPSSDPIAEKQEPVLTREPNP